MAKKKSEQKVFVPASLADAKWINTPFAYARLSRDLTLLQQNVLLKVSDQLQDHIKKFFEDKRNLLPDDPNSLFTPEVTASLPRIEIKLSDFGIDKSRYGEIHVAASAVSDLRIKAPNIQDDGTVNGYRMFPVFDEIVVPKTDENAADDEKYNYRTGVMFASINPKVAAYAFNMRLGYVNHPMQIAQDAGQVYSPRIYFLIKHLLPKGKSVVTIPYQKIREELGMSVLDRDTGEKISELYPQFSRFRTYVLDKAKADIDSMGKRNLIDITFDYEPVYKGFVNRGDPEAITFYVELTELGKYHKLPKSAKVDIKETPVAEPTKRRGRPRKDQNVNNEPSLDFAEAQPALIVGDRAGEWQTIVAEYGDGPLASVLASTRYEGTIDGAYSVTASSWADSQTLSQADDKLRELLKKYNPDVFIKWKVSYKK